MKAIELKKILIHRIAEINDESFLNAIKTILDSKTKTRIMKLTDEQKSDIKESRNDFEQGLVIEQAELDKEFDKWVRAR